MNVDQFGSCKTGTLIPINPGGRFNDYAFIPQDLPPNWEPDKSLWPLIALARDRVAKLDGAGGILPNPALLLRPLQRREAMKSNSIEGTFVSPEELLLFEAEKNQAKDPKSERRNDWREVMNYDSALAEGCRRITAGDKIDAKLLCALHRTLLLTIRGRDKKPGELRNVQVYVEAGRRYIPPPTEYLASLMDNLIDYLEREHSDPLVRSFIAHYQFEAIHPFQDGNGRLGRVILSLCIHKWLGHSHAWLYLSEYFEQNRREYISRMFSVSANGEWNEWIEFCLRGAIQQAESAISTCQKLNEIKRKYEQQVGAMGTRFNAIISKLLCNPIIEPRQLADDFSISYNTAKSDILKLVAQKILVELKHEGFRRKAFCATEIFDVAYG